MQKIVQKSQFSLDKFFCVVDQDWGFIENTLWKIQWGFQMESIDFTLFLMSQTELKIKTSWWTNRYYKFTSERYEMGNLWSETEPNLANNYSSDLGQL